MSSIRTPISLFASDRLAKLAQEGKIVPEGIRDAQKSPTDGERLTLRSLDVREYDRNPRRSLNPLADEIKESARARGGLSLGDLTVTRRPGSDDYMIYGGGNTRLRVIQELARELPDDPRFAHVSVVFREWRGEADIMAAHLIENEVRADTTFFDKAHGLTEFKAELEEAEGGRVMESKELCKRAEAFGWKLSRETIVLYCFVVQQLSAVGEWLSFRSAQTIKDRAGALTSLAKKLDPQRGPLLVQTVLAGNYSAPTASSG
jgi:hypothetical protein